MDKLLGDNETGANYQAEAVLAFLQGTPNIESSYLGGPNYEYLAKPYVAPWENCREQGYVIYMKNENGTKQINIAFFEHRNSDEIIAVLWNQITDKAPTIDTMDTGGTIYQTKWDYSHSVQYGKVAEMAQWILDKLEEFWKTQNNS